MYQDGYLAHIAADGRTQGLAEHLQGTAALAERFAAAFGWGDLGRLCGLAHDLGKYSDEFQARIRGASARVDHATAGSQALFAAGQAHGAFCVAGHHGGLPDGGNRKDSGDAPSLCGRMKKKIPQFDAWKTQLNLPTAQIPEVVGAMRNAMRTRMLYSCLVDGDFLDTEAFMSNGKILRGRENFLPALRELLDAHIEKRDLLKPVGLVNELRAEVLGTCIRAGEAAPGLFSLTVPTGGGKTLSSLAFALHHGVTHGMDRIIYVIPYCSIIDQTAAIFRGIFGEEHVLEHHSSAEYETDEDGCLTERGSKLALASENWDAPIVVTTSVQFFESLYGNRSSKCRKLHNMTNSVVIFDEAQMLPVPCLKPCVSAMGLLAEDYHTSVLLCTATQPALDQLFKTLSPGLVRRELCPERERLYTSLRRVRFQQTGRLSNEELACRLQAHDQVLCIVNSRKQAQEVFEMLKGEGCIHLSTLMIPGHRAQLIQEMRRRLAEGEHCRVVSTSLIEAGVDVDFPAVYRAEACQAPIIRSKTL